MRKSDCTNRICVLVSQSITIKSNTMKATINKSEKKLTDIHFEILEWKSNLESIVREISFVTDLLNSYAFEPKTPNLFERVQKFKNQIGGIEQEIENIQLKLNKQENNLGGIMEWDTISCDDFYYVAHESLKKEMKNFTRNYQNSKAEVFDYARSVLKNKKK